MTREEWHELIDYKQDDDHERFVLEQWERRFSNWPGECRSMSDGTLPMPAELAPPPSEEKDSSHFTSWRKSGLHAENPRNRGHRKSDPGCIEGRLIHEFIGAGSNRQHKKKRRCKHCGRTEIIE